MRVQWVHAGLLDAPLPAWCIDLVSAQYPALPRTAGHDAERKLLAAVAPGGLLVVVHHADTDAGRARESGLDPDDYAVPPPDVARLVDGTWQSGGQRKYGPATCPPVPGRITPPTSSCGRGA